jgi:uncharacterized Tic20 family protein
LARGCGDQIRIMENVSYLATIQPTSNERIAAFVAHAGTFVAWTIAPLCVYLIKRGESKYVEYQALQALLWSLLGTVTSILTCGLAIPVFMVFHVLAAIRSMNGEDYDYPLVADMAKKLMA